MGSIFDFVKDAGEKLFGGEAKETAREEAKADAMVKVVKGMNMQVENLRVVFDDGVTTVAGKVPSQEEKEKIVLLLGNTEGVARVDDRLQVEKPAPQATMYEVKSGDSLSKIAKAHYGDPMKYTVIFEANKPMLKDPNKIYPGQVLRIPPQDS